MTHPEVAIREIGVDGIVRHIENLAVNDMRSAIMRSTSQDFLNAKLGNIELKESHVHSTDGGASAPSYQHAQDEAKNELAKHLGECGIQLKRLNIEEVTILDKEVSEAMNKQSIELAEASAQMSVVSQQRQLAELKAKQAGAVLELQQAAKNRVLVDAAKAKLEAAKIEAKAQVAALEAQGELYKQYPDLFRLKQLELVMKGLTEMNLTVTTPELGAMLGGLLGRTKTGVTPSFVSGMFAPPAVKVKKESKEEDEQAKEASVVPVLSA